LKGLELLLDLVHGNQREKESGRIFTKLDGKIKAYYTKKDE